MRLVYILFDLILFNLIIFYFVHEIILFFCVKKNINSVDSLLQIHAIYNMLEIDTTIVAGERKTYEEELNQLEAKFLGKNVNLVKNFQLEQKKWEEKVDEIQSNLVANEYQWWMNALKHEERYPSALLRKIIEELIQSFEFEQREIP